MTEEEEEKLIAEIRADYLNWSGGVPPDDDRDVFIYVQFARSVDDEVFVTHVLQDWQDEVNEQPFQTPEWIREVLK